MPTPDGWYTDAEVREITGLEEITPKLTLIAADGGVFFRIPHGWWSFSPVSGSPDARSYIMGDG